MAADTAIMGLPTIKCSNCNMDVEISAMGEHVCTTVSQRPPAPRAHTFDDILSNGSKQAKSAPPQIDPSAANRPFLSRDSSRTPQRAASKSPFRPGAFKRSQTSPLPSDPPSPGRVNLDCAFPPWPTTARSQSPRLPSPTRTPRSNAPRSRGQASPAPYHLGPSAQQSTEEEAAQASLHQRTRGVSIESESSYRTSVSSGRYTESISGASIFGSNRRPSLSSTRGPRNFMDEPPPLPAGPVKSFRRDSQTSTEASGRSSSLARSNRKGHNGSDFALTDEPESYEHGKDTSDLSLHRAQTMPTGAQREDVVDAIRDSFQRRPSQPQHPPPPAKGNAIAEEGNGFNLSHFAKALGRENPFHTSGSSTSSLNSSPSDAVSGSSLSSPPSEASHNMQRKLSDFTQIDAALKNLQMNRESNLSNESEITKLTDLKPPPLADPLLRGPDSPTDPSLQLGSFSLRNDHFPPPKSPLGRDSPMKEPISRPATAPGQKRRCRGCGENIVGKSVSSADGRLTGRYHKTCFVCFTCRSPFQTADFYVLNDRPYCAHHYHELNGSLCAGCNQGIEGQYLETQERVGRGPNDFAKFHPDCLKCRTCRIVLRGDYFEWNGAVYCERDARRAAALTPPPSARRKPTMPSSPLAGPPGFPSGLPPPGRDGRRPSLPMGPGGPPQPRPPRNLVPPPAGARRFPERRTTKLMMI